MVTGVNVRVRWNRFSMGSLFSVVVTGTGLVVVAFSPPNKGRRENKFRRAAGVTSTEAAVTGEAVVATVFVAAAVGAAVVVVEAAAFLEPRRERPRPRKEGRERRKGRAGFGVASRSSGAGGVVAEGLDLK